MTWRPAAPTVAGSSCAPTRPPGSAALGTRVSTCTGTCARSVDYASCTPSTQSRGKLTRRYSARLYINASEGAGSAPSDESLGSSVHVFLPVIPASWAWPARPSPGEFEEPSAGRDCAGPEAPVSHGSLCSAQAVGWSAPPPSPGGEAVNTA